MKVDLVLSLTLPVLKASKIVNYKKMLDELGYEYKMIYVSASLDNAQKRNEKRARKLPPEIVKGDWDAASKELKTIQKYL